MKTSRKFIPCLALALLTGLPGNAQSQPAGSQRIPPPKGAEPKPFTVPARTTYQLPNGLTVSLVPYGQVPKTSIRVVLRTGNIDQDTKTVGLAELTGNMMKEGTTKRSSREVAEAAAAMGGAIDVTVGADQTSVSGDALSEFTPRMIELLAEVSMSPALPQSELERLRANAIREVTVARSLPANIAQEKFRAVLHGDHPYGRIFPTEDALTSFTLDDIKRFYAKNFGAKRAHVYVAGRFDAAAARKAIAATFGRWQGGPEPTVNRVKPTRAFGFHLVDRPGADQSVINLGLPVVDPSHPDYNRVRMMNTLLGGFFSSRVTSNIREQKGYTYAPFSTVSARYRDAHWVQVADVTTKVTGPSLKEIYAEIDRLSKENPTAAEMDLIQNWMAGSFIIQNSARNGILNQFSFVDLHGLGDDYLRNFVPDIRGITAEQVRATAAKYLKRSEMTLVVVGDKAQIAEQLTPYEKPQPSQQPQP